MAKGRTLTYHDFYCLNCGKKGLTLPRPNCLQRIKFHRKSLYCPNCKTEVNHVECRNDEEVFDFKTAFENGEFVNEAAESISYVCAANAWKQAIN